MADKNFGIKQLNLIGASGTPTITSPNNLNLNAVTVAISSDLSTGGQVQSTGGFNIGIQSGGINVTTGVVTALNFVGSGNTFSYNSLNKTVSISISGSGGSQWITTAAGIHTLSNVGIGTTNPTSRLGVAGTITPSVDATHDLGTLSLRWKNIYTNDLQLSNEGSQNEIDGTWGKWTIQEGENDLFIINRRTGKKYKFLLEEVT
jgi:hypothetical protein